MRNYRFMNKEDKKVSNGFTGNRLCNNLGFKKVMAMLVAFLLVFGLTAVERRCGEDMGVEETFMPQVRLVEDGVIKISAFSKFWILDVDR